MKEQKRYRNHEPEFRRMIAERMHAGECVAALAAEFTLARSMMYRWLETYRKDGPGALERSRGRQPGTNSKHGGSLRR